MMENKKWYKSYKLYIFDFDDTLIHTFRDVAQFHYPIVAESLGIEFKGKTALKENWGKKLDVSLPKVFNGKPVINKQQILNKLKEVQVKQPITPVNNATKILRTLKKHNKYISIATSGNLEFVENGIQNSLKMSLQEFDFIYSTVQFGTKKPSGEIVLTIKDAFEKKHKAIDFSEILYVGDSLSDYYTAKTFDLDFLAVTTGVTEKEQFIEAGLSEDCIFHNLEEAISPPKSHGIVALIQNEKGEYLFLQEGRKENPYYLAWSGPHGKCEPGDILEEETVVRETMEECGLLVKPISKAYQRAADTKIKTVAFWNARALGDERAIIMDEREVANVAWVSYEDIISEKIKLYPGTRDYFFNHAKNPPVCQKKTKNLLT